jgi:hypothetical protein
VGGCVMSAGPRLPRSARGRVILAFSADYRRVGAAILIEGRLADFATRPFIPDRSGAVDAGRLRHWVDDLFQAYEPELVAVVHERAGCDRALAALVAKIVDECSGRSGVPVLPLSVRELGEALRLERASHAELRRLLVQAYALVGQRLRFVRGQRSESERYWNSSLLALGAAEAVYRRMAPVSTDPSPPLAGPRPPDGCFTAPNL